MTPVEAEARRIAVALADLRADLRASEDVLASIVRAWEAASPDDRALADALVPGLREAVEEARDGRAGEWWR
jgi:hypothetical protein